MLLPALLRFALSPAGTLGLIRQDPQERERHALSRGDTR